MNYSRKDLAQLAQEYRSTLVDEVLPEPLGGAHRDVEATAEAIRTAVSKHLAELESLGEDQLLQQRQQRLAGFGQFREA